MRTVLFLVLMFLFSTKLLCQNTNRLDSIQLNYTSTLDEWKCQDSLCNGAYSIYYNQGFYKGRLDRILFFHNGQLDSIKTYKFAFLFPGSRTLNVASIVFIDASNFNREVIIYWNKDTVRTVTHFKSIKKQKQLSKTDVFNAENIGEYVMHGYHCEYFQNGVKKLEGCYKQGMKDGYWSFFDEYGNLIKRIKYIKDKPRG